MQKCTNIGSAVVEVYRQTSAQRDKRTKDCMQQARKRIQKCIETHSGTKKHQVKLVLRMQCYLLDWSSLKKSIFDILESYCILSNKPYDMIRVYVFENRKLFAIVNLVISDNGLMYSTYFLMYCLEST